MRNAFVFPDFMILKTLGQDLDLIVMTAISIFEKIRTDRWC
jgi:hypothetical protein